MNKIYYQLSKTYLLLLLIGLPMTLAAQNRTITGNVASGKGRISLPGVNVVAKGSQIGTTTDAEGNFQLSVPGEYDALVFSFIGFQSKEVVIGNQKIVNVELLESAQELSEVVVTALGFKEEADKLALTSSKVSGDNIKKSGEPDLINSLAGKASGVQIARQAGDPGSGSFIQIRGLNTITGNNQPLIIVDGIPVSNSSLGNGISASLQQSRLNDINPNDIASVQVLKGASAAALWGSRAANGVIVITTKSGNKDKLSISYNASLSFDQVNVPYHPRQTTYGQGAAGIYSSTATNSWGDRIADRSGGEDEVNKTGAYFKGESGKLYYPITKKNSKEVFTQKNYDALFQTGTAWDHSLSFSGGNDKSLFYLSIGDLRQKGLFKSNSDYNRTSLKLNTERKFNDIFRISTNSTYSRVKSDRIGRGNRTSGAPAALLRNAPDFDQYDYKGDYYSSPTASPIIDRQRSYRSQLGAVARPGIGNPQWAIYEQTYNTSVNRFINNVEFGIKPVSWFDLTARAGYDFYTDERLEYFPVNDYQNNGNGQFTESLTKEGEFTTDVIGRITRDFGKNFSLTYIAGFNVNNRSYYYTGKTINNFIIADAPPSFANATAENRIPINDKSLFRSARAYNSASFSAYDALFLNVSLAGEAGSGFGQRSKKTFYYPSADLAWQFTKLGFLNNSQVLSFGKLRASYGVVGVQPLPYKTTTTFESVNYTQSNGDYLYGSLYGNGAFIQSGQQGNNLLRPERKTEYEIGTDLRFLDNRIKLGVTYYQNKVKDILIPVGLAGSTGFTSRYSNAASLENKGVEADLGIDIVRSDDWKWSVNANFSRIRNKVTSLSGNNFVQTTGSSIIDPVAVVGYPVGVFWGGKYKRNEGGDLSLDKNNFPQLDANFGVVGNPNPEFTGAFGTSFSYKKFSLDVLFETSQGGEIYEGTRAVMYNFGTHEGVGNDVTLAQDVKNYAGKTIASGSTVRGNLVDFGGGQVLLDESYYTSLGGGFSDLKEPWVSDASWTRLRQLSLSYHLDSPKFRKLTKLQSIDFSATGRNLLLWTKIEGIDPDTNIGGTLLSRGQDYFNTPNTRSYVFSIKLTY